MKESKGKSRKKTLNEERILDELLYQGPKPFKFWTLIVRTGGSTQSPFGCRKESEEMESERVKMESRVKLSNDGKVKFVGPMNSVRWREKYLWVPGYM